MRNFIIVMGVTLAGTAHAQDMGPATDGGGFVDAGGITCMAPQLPCGRSHCHDPTTVCCAAQGHEELSCPMGTTCKTDGTCDYGCMNGGTATIASCGGDVCGCSAVCKSHQDCSSGCCTSAGFCAPYCVCQSQGLLYLSCSTTGQGYGAGSFGGCSAFSGGTTTAIPLLAAFALALVIALRRRRKRN